jgi:MFS family permease
MVLPEEQQAIFSGPTVDEPPSANDASYLRDRNFWGITLTQFLGAFNDNIYKQTLLLLFVAAPLAVGAAQTRDVQWVGQLMFCLPFILFSGFAGFLSDRYSKRRVIVLSKVAEIVVMAVGLGVFVLVDGRGMAMNMVLPLSSVVFLMGAQSAFFGPGKYGVLPELFPQRQLPAVNGIVIMTTFIAIILGTALGGWLKELFPGRLVIVGGVCVVIAVIGTLTSLQIRKLPPSQPDLPFDLSMLAIPRQIVELMRSDRQLGSAIWVSTIFWTAGSMVQLSVNYLGKEVLGVGDAKTSFMVSTISIGIALGSVTAGLVSRGRVNLRLVLVGATGLSLSLLLLALPGPGPGGHLLNYPLSMLTLIVVGIFTGIFAVPLQVILQERPPVELRGRMIATQNLLNWIGITGSAVVYALAGQLLDYLHLPKFFVFLVSAGMMGAVAIFYRPTPPEKAAV